MTTDCVYHQISLDYGLITFRVGVVQSLYGKIFAGMYQGSLFGKPALCWAVWSYVIACQVPEDDRLDCEMVVELNPVLLAAMFSTGVEEVERVIEGLCAPDPRSRTKREGGRRLVALEGRGMKYRVVNGRYYRDLASEEKRRSDVARAVRRHRNLKRGKPLPGEAAYVRAVEAMGEELEGMK